MISLLNINLGMSDIVATDNLFHHRVSIMSGNGLQNITALKGKKCKSNVIMAIEVAMEEAHPYNNWSDFHIPSVYAYRSFLSTCKGAGFQQCFNGLFIACS